MRSTELLSAINWTNFERVIVLSPHLDDAALSCASLLTTATRVSSRLVVTIAAGNPMRRPAASPESGPRKMRVRNGLTAPALRRREDIAAMHAMNCDFVHLGYADAIDRRSPDTGNLVYRQRGSHWREPHGEDGEYIEQLRQTLRILCDNMGRYLLVSPLGVGRHVDHRICAEIVLQLQSPRRTLLFYEDFPYTIHREVGDGHPDSPIEAMQRLGVRARKYYHADIPFREKVAVLANYESQIGPLFGSESEMRDSLLDHTVDGRCREYFWAVSRSTDP